MAYTNVWSDTIPLGTDLASTIDDSIRQLRLDIHDRMDSIVNDWTADPVTLQSGIVTDTIQKNLFIHHSAFAQDDPRSTVTRIAEKLTVVPFATSVLMWAPVILPVGAVITGVVFNMTQGAGLPCNIKLRKVVFNTAPTPPTASDILTFVTDNSSFKEYILNGSYTVLNNDVLFLEVQLFSVSEFYNAAVTYSVNSLSQTV